jgi:hypothetical protein
MQVECVVGKGERKPDGAGRVATGYKQGVTAMEKHWRRL